MTRYYCYRKHPEWFTLHREASFPVYKEFMTYEEWVEQGKPNDKSIHFLGLGNQPPQLKAYWNKRKQCQKVIG